MSRSADLDLSRKSELAFLIQAFRKSKAQKGTTVLISGAEGIGKTWLIRQLSRFLANKPVDCLVAPPAIETESSWLAFSSMIAQRLEDPRSTPRQIQRLISGYNLAVLSRINPGLSRHLNYNPGMQLSQLPTDRAIILFLRSLSRINPLVAIIDDLDSRSHEDIALFFQLAQHISSEAVLLIGTLEIEKLDDCWKAEISRLKAREIINELTLQGLEFESTSALVNELTRDSSSTFLSEHIHSVTGGNPLFIKELVAGFTRQGLFRRKGDPDRQFISEIFPVVLSPSLELLVRENINALSDSQKELLSEAAVLGQSFAASMLTRNSGMDLKELTVKLDALAKAGILERIDQSQWRFQAGLVRKVVLLSLPRDGHVQILKRTIESLGNPADQASVSLRLRLIADLHDVQPQLSFDHLFLFEAACRAESVFDRRLALRLYKAALKILQPGQDPKQECRIRLAVLKLKRFNTPAEELIDELTGVIPELESLEMNTELVNAHVELTSRYLKINDLDRTLDTLDRLDGLLQKIQGTPDHVFNLTEYFLLRFQCAYRLDDSESLNRTIRLLDELPSDRFTKEQAWRYQSSRAAVALDEDDFETFWQWIHRCETHAMQSIDPLIKFQTSLLKGTAETRAGRFSEGELLLRSTESFFWESGFYTFFCDALLQLGLNLYYQGRHQESIDTFHRLIRSDFRNQVPVSYILAEAGCARVYNDQGKTGEALDHVEQGLGIRLSSPFFFGEGLLWLEKARSLILSGKGDPSRAIQCAQKALKCLEPLRSEDYCISLILQADLQMGSGDADESKALLDRAVLEIERLKSPAGKVRAWMALAGTYASLTASGRSDTGISLRETLGKIISLSDNLKTPHSRYEIETLLERYGLKDDFKQHLGVLTRGPVMHQDHGVIEVNICGRFEVRLPGTQDLLPRKTWGSDKSRMLFHALILAGQDNAGQTRESLGARIWPEISQERLPNAFHIALSHVRKAIDPLGHALEFKNGRYRLNPEFFQVDAWIIQSELKKAFKFDRAGQPHLACEARKKAAGLYLGDILPDRYEEWIDQTRAHLRLEIRHAMMWLIRRYHELGLTYDVISTAQQLIEIDPADEDAHRYLIESMNAAGDRSGAIRQYQRLIRILKSELEVEPDPTTVQLMSKIMVSD